MFSGRLIAGLLLALGLGLSVAPARAEPPALSIYGALPGFERASISPSGDHVAILGFAGGQRRLVVVDAAQKIVFQVPIEPTFKVRGLHWAGDKAVLLHYTNTVDLGIGFTAAKAELQSVIVLPIDGGKPWVVFANQPMITGGVRGIHGVVQRNGHWYGYFGGFTLVQSRGGEGYLPSGRLQPDLYEVDLETRKVRRAAAKIDADQADRSWLVDASGAVGASLDIASQSGRWTIFNARNAPIASGIDRAGGVTLLGFSADGASLVYQLRNAAAERDDLFIVPLAGGAAQPFLPDTTVQRFFMDNGHRLIGYVEDNATSDVHFFTPRSEKIYKASQRAFPGARMTLQDANDGFDRLIVTTEGDGDPGSWWLINIATGKADVLGYSFTLRPGEVGPTRMVSYAAADGLKMEGVLTLPPDRPARKLPIVMLPHGGPTHHDVLSFDWMAQAFASRGYAVFQPNFRGSSGYGVPFEQAGNGQWGRKMQTDISDALAELVRQGIADPRRACIMGASYGGYAALAGVTLQQGIYRCAVAVAGISDLSRMVSTDLAESGGDPMLARNLKAQLGSGADLKTVSPIRFVDKVGVPVLLIHGKDDIVVNYNQSSSMANALRDAGKTVELVTLKDEDHWLSKSETRLQMLRASVDFVMKHNPPDAVAAQPASSAAQ